MSAATKGMAAENAAATITECRVARTAFRRRGGRVIRTFTDKRVGYFVLA